MAVHGGRAELHELLQEPALWKYRGEGGATLVLSHPRENLVLRLRKRRIPSPQGGNAEFSDDKRIFHNLQFCQNVFRPLMGAQYVQECKIVDLPEGFVGKINHNCRELRPTHRLGMMADENCEVGVVMPDFCLFTPANEVPCIGLTEQVDEPTFCVEIKPKCGFVPTSRWITAEHSSRRDVCHYCMLQKLKVKEGKYQRQSRYCPVDLFSGVGGRVKHALECLVADPQNNWRVFQDGCVVYSDETCEEALRNKSICCYEMLLEKSLHPFFTQSECAGVTAGHTCGAIGPRGNKFIQIMLQILINDSLESEQDMTSCKARADTAQVCQGSRQSSTEKHALDSVNSTFGMGGVLWKLLSIQKVDDLDVEGVLPLYQQVKKLFDANAALATELGVCGPFTTPLWKNIISQHQNKDMTSSHDATFNCLDSPFDGSYDRDHLENAVQKICELMIASTAKDCSIMITCQKSPQKHLPFVTDTSGVSYRYNINLVDLDPKGFDRVVKYHKDICRVVQTYIQ